MNDVKNSFDFLMACFTGRESDVERMLIFDYKSERDWAGNTGLHLACLANSSTVVRRLLEDGFLADERNKFGQTPLNIACRRGFIDIARLLIEGGSDVGLADFLGMTPLHWASERNESQLVTLLIETGGSPDVLDRVR